MLGTVYWNLQQVLISYFLVFLHHYFPLLHSGLPSKLTDSYDSGNSSKFHNLITPLLSYTFQLSSLWSSVHLGLHRMKDEMKWILSDMWALLLLLHAAAFVRQCPSCLFWAHPIILQLVHCEIHNSHFGLLCLQQCFGLVIWAWVISLATWR